jgi:hypothetical protein
MVGGTGGLSASDIVRWPSRTVAHPKGTRRHCHPELPLLSIRFAVFFCSPESIRRDLAKQWCSLPHGRMQPQSYAQLEVVRPTVANETP